VTKGLSLVSLLAALAIGGYLFMAQAKTAGPTSDLGQKAQADAAAQAGAASFQAAAPVLQAWFAERGTYAGATLPPSYGVVVAQADATSYCLQAGSGEGGQHVRGPGGAPAPGPC
jgi:hypothetical protein